MTARRRLVRARLRLHLSHARCRAWYRSRTGVGRAGAVLASGVAVGAVLAPFVGPGDGLMIGLVNGVAFEAVMALGERWLEPRLPATARA